MDWVSDENNVRDLRDFDGLVNTTPNNKEFSLRENDANCYNQCLLKTAWTWIKGMTITIGCAGVVSVSASCGRHYNLT